LLVRIRSELIAPRKNLHVHANMVAAIDTVALYGYIGLSEYLETTYSRLNIKLRDVNFPVQAVPLQTFKEIFVYLSTERVQKENSFLYKINDVQSKMYAKQPRNQ